VTLRWGVLGVSEFARRAVLPVLRRSRDSTLVAIASRSQARADAEARRFGAPHAHASYEALLADPEVDAVYLPLPNALHVEWALRALNSGRHVLCEKPLAPTAKEAQLLADAALANRRVLMEGYMTAFHPRQERLIAAARAGALGQLRSLRAVFSGKRTDFDDYRWQPEMGGGALLDLGIYCLEPMTAIAGEPARVAAVQSTAPSGVDASFSGWLEFDGGVTGSFFVSFEAPEEQSLEIVGTEGRVRLEPAFTAGRRDGAFLIERPWGRREQVRTGGLDPYAAMVEHFAAVVAGETPSRRPPEASVATLALCERLRAAAGA
jgi:predicted dehydrogenase